jgi:hypothetical protein
MILRPHTRPPPLGTSSRQMFRPFLFILEEGVALSSGLNTGLGSTMLPYGNYQYTGDRQIMLQN